MPVKLVKERISNISVKIKLLLFVVPWSCVGVRSITNVNKMVGLTTLLAKSVACIYLFFFYVFLKIFITVCINAFCLLILLPRI